MSLGGKEGGGGGYSNRYTTTSAKRENLSSVKADSGFWSSESFR